MPEPEDVPAKPTPDTAKPEPQPAPENLVAIETPIEENDFNSQPQ